MCHTAAVQRTAESVLSEIFPCVVACGLVEGNIEAYTMQISGEQSYIAGSYTLIEFKDIRRYSHFTGQKYSTQSIGRLAINFNYSMVQ